MAKKRLPTAKQAKALQLIREGVKPMPAMQQAGYSKDTSRHPANNLLRRPGAQTILEQMQDAYLAVGISPEFLVMKEKEWITAQKRDQYTGEVVPDYATQQKAAQMIRQDFGLVQDAQGPTVNNTQNNLILTDEQLKRIIEG